MYSGILGKIGMATILFPEGRFTSLARVGELSFGIYISYYFLLIARLDMESDKLYSAYVTPEYRSPRERVWL